MRFTLRCHAPLSAARVRWLVVRCVVECKQLHGTFVAEHRIDGKPCNVHPESAAKRQVFAIRAVSFASSVGSVPVSRLLPMPLVREDVSGENTDAMSTFMSYMAVKAVIWPRTVGIVPLRRFTLNDRWLSAVIRARKDGTVPVSIL